ncbi:dihydropteroate synthase [Aurantimonas sp. C2-6-R+9]|uniref:dihydropteroate synthase n=1 Tax=unclassified Aurantimonas TaxID=2638230 RepID=UPI002E17CCC1|nr:MULTISPECIES: dihydropteroate synthase [unclassified Aurantimonas]MEC5291305.1 dihydropteroate synthase [Aurantimonas sp. C2-3-R2]MEC5381511.1 dihydropteroate synthase [Aurantimonas sp. C2-6-R+9]MEC5412392.1 dihydropteroate synthase [Aurantimonas sp. C2-4-R8]
MDLIEPRGGIWHVAHGRSLDLSGAAHIMGVLNATPDSFSDGGRYASVEAAVAESLKMVEEGAAIVDIGGESTRPGAMPIDAAEEQRRIMPVIEELARRSDCLISVDTYRSETARLAVTAGAHIVNDVWGAQRDEAIAKVAAETGAGLCLMHTGREREKRPDVIDDQFLFLEKSLEIARNAGVPDAAIVLDPGFGFAKDGPENLMLLARLDELKALGFPLLVGTSRKRFVRGAVGSEDPEPDIATAATSALLRERGADIFRVHNVPANRDALRITDAMRRAMKGERW